jgi:hypothetical protein
MFTDMFEALDKGSAPMESFYEGYLVNAIMDACYHSVKTKKWEPVELEVWRGKSGLSEEKMTVDYDDQFYLIKEEKLADGRKKVILKDKSTGEIIQRVVN